MRKIISIILIFIFISCNVAFATPICITREEVLKNINIIDEHMMNKEFLTRSDCVKMGSNMLFGYDFVYEEYCGCLYNIELSSIFHDMDKSREDYVFFSNLYLQGGIHDRMSCWDVYVGYIQGDERGIRPDDLISWPEFVTLFMRLTNWDVYAKLENEQKNPGSKIKYPDSYFDIAERIGLTKYCKEGYVTPEAAVDFIYELIQAPYIMRFGTFTSGVNYEFEYGDYVIKRIGYRIDTNYVENSEQSATIREKYNITDNIELDGKNVLIIYHNEDSEIVTDAVVLDDVFVFKGEENEIQKKIYSHGPIRQID